MRCFALRMHTSAVLFDLDGTLADTDPLHAEAWYRALLEVTGRQLDREEYFRRCVRNGLTPLEYIASLGVDPPLQLLRARKAAHYEQLARELLTVRDGTPELVRALEAIPVPVGIVSSSSQSSVDIFLRLFWPVSGPAVVISRDDDVASKPNPDPYVLAVQRLGRSAPMCVAIENSPRGIDAAKSAGLRCVAVLTEDYSASELAAADVVTLGFTHIRVTACDGGAVMAVAEL